MNNNQREQWKKIRAKGKMRFILLRGVLSWGLPTGVIYSLFTHSSENMMAIVQTTIIFLITGVFLGLFYWMYMEKKYQNINNHTN